MVQWFDGQNEARVKTNKRLKVFCEFYDTEKAYVDRPGMPVVYLFGEFLPCLSSAIIN